MPARWWCGLRGYPSNSCPSSGNDFRRPDWPFTRDVVDPVVERAKGIEPSYAAWEAAVLPLNYARLSSDLAETRRFAKRLAGYAGCSVGHWPTSDPVSKRGFSSRSARNFPAVFQVAVLQQLARC